LVGTSGRLSDNGGTLTVPALRGGYGDPCHETDFPVLQRARRTESEEERGKSEEGKGGILTEEEGE
tara:strand:- start:582 stop:779 length:198 start_codon:yes stop_codon:yes gene_type:complete